MPNYIECLDYDPFDEPIDYSKYNRIILDIKKNNRGETWVKYKRLNEGVIEFTEEIQAFAKMHTRIKKSEI